MGVSPRNRIIMKNNSTTQDILHGSLIKAIIAISVPVLINSFLQTTYNLTDTFWLGRLGTNELAAINLVSPVQNIVVNFGSGITLAGTILIAQLIGAGNHSKAKNLASEIFICSVGFAVVMAAIVSACAGLIVGWLGADEITGVLATTYLRLVILDMPFLFIVNCYQSVNQAQGNTLSPMLLNLLGIVVNMILDPLFMLVFGWGCAGAAIATVLAKLVPAVLAVILLLNKNKEIHISFKEVEFYKADVRDIITVGFPSAIGGSAMQVGFLIMTKTVFTYGTAAMAAYGIGNKCNSFITLPINGMGSAVSTIVGQNVGANQYDRAYKGYKLSMYISIAFLFVMGMIVSQTNLATWAVSIFSSDEEVIPLAADFFSIMAMWCFTNGMHDVTSGLFKGAGHTEITMIDEIARLWIFRFGTLYVCEHFLKMGVRSVWYSVVVSNAIAAILLYVIMLTGFWKKKRVNN